MKVKYFLPLLTLPLLASCGGNGDGKKLADIKDATRSDSVMYYFGQMNAVDYWRQNNGDTTMLTDDARAEYLRGVRAGMEAARESEAYNQGLYAGVQMAMGVKEFETEYGLKCNPRTVIEGVTAGLESDTAVNISDTQMNFRRLMDAIDSEKQAEDAKLAAQALEKDAAAQKMTKVNDNLYAGKILHAGSGPKIQNGDSIAAILEIKVFGTKENIDQRAHHNFIVGTILPGPFTEALKTMQVGEARQFITTAPALFGRLYTRRGLAATDILELTITTNKVGAIPEPVKAAPSKAN